MPSGQRGVGFAGVAGAFPRPPFPRPPFCAKDEFESTGKSMKAAAMTTRRSRTMTSRSAMLYNEAAASKSFRTLVVAGIPPSCRGAVLPGAFRRLDTRFGVVATLPFKRPSERREVLERWKKPTLTTFRPKNRQNEIEAFRICYI